MCYFKIPKQMLFWNAVMLGFKNWDQLEMFKCSWKIMTECIETGDTADMYLHILHPL